jgi:hypothetical protein
LGQGGDAFVDAELVDALVGADFVGLGGVRDVEDFAEVAEVPGRGGSLSKGGGIPFANEVQQVNWHRRLG